MIIAFKETIFDEIRRVALEQSKKLPPLTDDLALSDLGLDSLCFAILVTRLEDIAGRDPFASASLVVFPRTLGEFVAMYEKSLG